MKGIVSFYVVFSPILVLCEYAVQPCNCLAANVLPITHVPRRVEFNNKFYKGEGYLFAPFNYRDCVEGNIDEM